MDIFVLLFLSGVSVLVGVILTLVVQYYVLLVYFKKSPVVVPPKKPNTQVCYSLPEALKKELEKDNYNDKTNDSSLPISLVLQFLFHELRHTDCIKRWLYKKLSLEFDELLSKTTIGKFFEAVNIRDMHLGSQFPDIRSITIENVKLDKSEGHIDILSLCLDLDYTGNFLLSVDAKMKFGKTAYLSIKVRKISGLGRLQFTRLPYTHWNFSFYNEPVIELTVESHFQGRQLQSNITNLIVNQIKKAIKRKHTLPNYKIRYKPFFLKTDPGQLDLEDSDVLSQGQLEVTCVEITRLSPPPGVILVYYTMTVDTTPWISVYQKDERMYMMLEVTLTKIRQAPLGVIFKQEQGFVTVENVTPNSLAFRAGLKVGDVIFSVESKTVNTVPQVAKLIKSSPSNNLTLRIERLADNYVLKIKTDNIVDKSVVLSSETAPEEAELTQTEQDSFVIVDSVKIKSKSTTNVEKLKTPDKVPKIIASNENVSKFAQTIGNFTLRKRKTSAERSSADGNNKNTPTSTPVKQHTITVPAAVLTTTTKKHSMSEVPEIVRTDSESLDSEILNYVIEVDKSSEVSIASLITYNEEFVFNLKDNHKYLNVNVWGTMANDRDVLLGYTNIPLAHILNECCGSMLGHYIKSYSFLPPHNISPNSQTHPLMTHSGFEHVFCYGDILLSFVWTHDGPLEMKQKPVDNSESDIKPTVTSTTFGTKHDFVRTQFHRTTHCNFCTKKIWLKDAVQCKECALCCHKKCISKCQMSMACVPADKTSLKSETIDLMQPEITTEVYEETIEQGSSLKRVNSVNNLAIPGTLKSTNQSRSLPPSPQRTPSRKQSLASINPFTLCPDVLDEVQNRQLDSGEAIEKLLEQVLLCPPDELLMDAAKDSGQKMYAGMPHEEKVDKINIMVTELKKMLDLITAQHMQYSTKMATETCEVERTKLAFLMGQADAKIHGLSVLMLHYCSGLQQTQEKIV